MRVWSSHALYFGKTQLRKKTSVKNTPGKAEQALTPIYICG